VTGPGEFCPDDRRRCPGAIGGRRPAIAAQANRTRTLIASAEATDAPDGHAPHDGDQIALGPVRRNVASSDSGDAGASGA
jgi:hypothetical protein